MSRNIAHVDLSVTEKRLSDDSRSAVTKGSLAVEDVSDLVSSLENLLFPHVRSPALEDEEPKFGVLRALPAIVSLFVELASDQQQSLLGRLARKHGFEAVCEALLDVLADACNCLYVSAPHLELSADDYRMIGLLCVGAVAHLATALVEFSAALDRHEDGLCLPGALAQAVQVLHDMMFSLPRVADNSTAEHRERQKTSPSPPSEAKGVGMLFEAMQDVAPAFSTVDNFHFGTMSENQLRNADRERVPIETERDAPLETLVVQDSIAETCEVLWSHNWADRHLVGPHMILFLLAVAAGRYGNVGFEAGPATYLECTLPALPDSRGFASKEQRQSRASLREDAVRRLYQVRHAFFCIPMENIRDHNKTAHGNEAGSDPPEAAEHVLVSSLIAAFEDSLVVQNSYARKWLALCLSGVLSQDLTRLLHKHFIESIIFELHGKRLCQYYAEIYFRAWCIAHAACRENLQYGLARSVFEQLCLRDFAEKSILSKSSRLARVCRQILAAFHAQKRLPGVDNALAYCYEPIIYRALLRSTNPRIRQNACYLFFDAFPLLREDGSDTDPLQLKSSERTQDVSDDEQTKTLAPSSPRGDVLDDLDTQLAGQFAVLPRVLFDKSPVVRKLAVDGVCRLLTIFWDLFPAADRVQLLQLLTGELALDAASATVRESVCRGILRLMLEQPLAQATLRTGLLRGLRTCLHDRNRRVQLAAAELVLGVSRSPSLRWYDVCSLQEDILPYMSAGDTMDSRLTCLLLPSFFTGLDANLDEDVDPLRYTDTLARCVEFIRLDAVAAWHFYASLGPLALEPRNWLRNLPPISIPCVRSICKFIAVLGKAVIELTQQDPNADESSLNQRDHGGCEKELVEPLFVILCETYRSVAAVVYDGEHSDCRVFLERQLALETLFALVDALPSEKASLLGGARAETRSVMHFWRLLSALPKSLMEDLSEECLSSVSEALRIGAQVESFVPAVEALIAWGRGADVFGSRVLLPHLTSILETASDGASDCSVQTMESVALLCEWVLFQPALRSHIEGDHRFIRSCRALQALLTRFLDAKEQVSQAVRVIAAKLLGCLIIANGLVRDADRKRARHSDHSGGQSKSETAPARYCIRAATIRSLLDAYEWAFTNVTDSNPIGTLPQEGALYLSECLALGPVAGEGLDEATANRVGEQLMAPNVIAACRVAWHLLPHATCHAQQDVANAAIDKLLCSALRSVVEAVGAMSPLEPVPWAEASAAGSPVEHLLVRRALVRTLRTALRKRMQLLISVLTPCLVSKLEEECACGDSHDELAPPASLWELPCYGNLLRETLAATGTATRVDEAVHTRPVAVFAGRMVDFLLSELSDEPQRTTVTSSFCKLNARLLLLCACVVHCRLSAETFGSIESALQGSAASRALLSTLRMRVAFKP